MTGTLQERSDKYERVKDLWSKGCSFQEISQRLGIHISTAYNIVDQDICVDKKNFLPYNLTRTELEICKLLVEGKNSCSIATVLTLSCRTVECYIGRIYIKLNIEKKSGICQRVVAVMKLKDLF